MLEFVMVVPFLAFILSLVFFFGWGMMNKHAVLVSDRYTVWRAVESSSPSKEEINANCFRDKAVNIDLDGEVPVTQTGDDLVTKASGESPGAGSLADTLINNVFPGGRKLEVTASFKTIQTYWARLTGDTATIKHKHGREGVTWRRDEVDCWGTLRDQYYSGMDGSLKAMPNPANGLAGVVRGLYLTHW
jgi:hypothetical protein